MYECVEAVIRATEEARKEAEQQRSHLSNMPQHHDRQRSVIVTARHLERVIPHLVLDF